MTKLSATLVAGCTILCAGVAIGAESAPEPAQKASLKPINVLGWVGPVSELAGAWEDTLHNCMGVQTALPADVYEAETPEKQLGLLSLHEMLLTQWEHQKTRVALGCDEAYADLPVLSRCRFLIPFAAVRADHLKGENLALVEKYRDRGAVVFNYKYYNPETALDDPLFKDRCLAIDGDWQEVTKDSSEYQAAKEIYRARSGSSVQLTKKPQLDDLFKGKGASAQPAMK